LYPGISLPTAFLEVLDITLGTDFDTAAWVILLWAFVKLFNILFELALLADLRFAHDGSFLSLSLFSFETQQKRFYGTKGKAGTSVRHLVI
jgi:hypothetical protein